MNYRNLNTTFILFINIITQSLHERNLPRLLRNTIPKQTVLFSQPHPDRPIRILVKCPQETNNLHRQTAEMHTNERMIMLQITDTLFYLQPVPAAQNGAPMSRPARRTASRRRQPQPICLRSSLQHDGVRNGSATVALSNSSLIWSTHASTSVGTVHSCCSAASALVLAAMTSARHSTAASWTFLFEAEIAIACFV